MTDQEKNSLIYKLLADSTISDSPDFTDDEWAGLCAEAPMTFDLYISSLEKCIEGNYCECYFEIIEQFPEYSKQYVERFEEVHGIEPMTPTEVEESWQKFKAKMRKKYGDNFV